jgi:hypothetical protein
LGQAFRKILCLLPEGGHRVGVVHQQKAGHR